MRWTYGISAQNSGSFNEFPGMPLYNYILMCGTVHPDLYIGWLLGSMTVRKFREKILSYHKPINTLGSSASQNQRLACCHFERGW